MNKDGLIKNKVHTSSHTHTQTGGVKASHNIIRWVTRRDFSLVSDIFPLSVLLLPAINPAGTQHSTYE